MTEALMLANRIADRLSEHADRTAVNEAQQSKANAMLNLSHVLYDLCDSVAGDRMLEKCKKISKLISF